MNKYEAVYQQNCITPDNCKRDELVSTFRNKSKTEPFMQPITRNKSHSLRHEAPLIRSHFSSLLCILYCNVSSLQSIQGYVKAEG